MPRSSFPTLEWLAPICVRVLFKRPEYRDVFPLADVVDQAVRSNA